MTMNKFARALLGAWAVLLAAAAPAVAQGDAAASYPSKPIRIVIPFGAGGGNDLFARLVGQKFSELIGQTVVIENKPGAGGRIAAEYVMNQPHDGYTLFVGASGVMSVASAIYPNLPYHPTKTLVPLTMTANFRSRSRPHGQVCPKPSPHRSGSPTMASSARRDPPPAHSMRCR
jgi:tripartite-type tricarboxylate transporter receptor subunit TctC